MIQLLLHKNGGKKNMEHNFEPLEFGGFSAYISHEDSAFTRKLDKYVKSQAINLLFGEVTAEQEKLLNDYMDTKYAKCHSLALYITADERFRHNDMSDFHSICNQLGIDPGEKTVLVNEHGSLFFAEDYHYFPKTLF